MVELLLLVLSFFAAFGFAFVLACKVPLGGFTMTFREGWAALIEKDDQ